MTFITSFSIQAGGWVVMPVTFIAYVITLTTVIIVSFCRVMVLQGSCTTAKEVPHRNLGLYSSLVLSLFLFCFLFLFFPSPFYVSSVWGWLKNSLQCLHPSVFTCFAFCNNNNNNNSCEIFIAVSVVVQSVTVAVAVIVIVVKVTSASAGKVR